jgi:uncharacterized integral membrane protein
MTTEPRPMPTTAVPQPGAGGEPPHAGWEHSAPQQPAPPPQQPAPHPQRPAHQPLPHHTIKRTRVGGLWVAMACFAIVLLLLLIFILENRPTVDISYFGAHVHLPLGVALLLAAVCGVLLAVLAGAVRMSQLRATARRHRRADASHAAAASGVPDGTAR